jgi:hypothetical protein
MIGTCRYSEPGVEDGVGQPYLPVLKVPLSWSSWNDTGPDDDSADSGAGSGIYLIGLLLD